MLSGSWGEGDIGTCFVEHGANVNQRDSEGKTVMMVSLSEWPRRADMHLIHMLLMLHYAW